VFTARYALSPYLKQVRFVFKELTYTYALLRDSYVFNLWQFCFYATNGDGIVSVVTWLGAGRSGILFPTGLRGFLLPKTVHELLVVLTECTNMHINLHILFI
jgi:hypothetical protein